MKSQASTTNSQGATFAAIVNSWEAERSVAGYVQPYTAQKAAEKARLFVPWVGDVAVDEIAPSAIKHALIELGQHGGKAGKGLSSSTLRAAHLAGTQAVDWAIESGVAAVNPFRRVPRPKANLSQAKFLLPREASTLASDMAKLMGAEHVANEAQHA